MAPSEAAGNRRGYRTVLLARFSALGDVAMTVGGAACLCRHMVDFEREYRQAVERPRRTLGVDGGVRSKGASI